MKKLTHPRFIYDQLSGINREKEFVVAMRMLAHFKKQKSLRRCDLRELAGGSWLRDNTVNELITPLRGRKLLRGRTDGQKWTARRSLYRKVAF